MKAWRATCLLVLLAGCVASPPATTALAPALSPSPVVPSSPTDTGSAAPPLRIATGVWFVGEFGEAEPPPTVSESSAYQPFPILRLSQDGGALSLTRSEYCGASSEDAVGTLNGARVRLEGMSYRGRLGAPLIYDLTYDAETQRFRGTRNGQPVWLAPGRATPSAGICSIPVTGVLFNDLKQRLMNGATVRVSSLNPSYPYDTVLEAVNGQYVVQGLFPGMIVRVTAEAPGMKPQSRDVSVERGPEWRVNFGGPRDREDPEGWKYPLTPLVTPSPLPSGPSGRV